MDKNFMELKKVEALLANYFDAVMHADVEKLKTIFHEEASMYGYLGDVVIYGKPDIFFADLLSKPSMKQDGVDCSYIIKSIEITGKIARAVILVDQFFGVATVEDQFHLVEKDGVWNIVCKTFTTL